MSETIQPYGSAERARGMSPRDPRLGPWRAFLTAHALVTRRLDEDLRTEQQMTLAEYEALLHLAQAPEQRLRMNQLADRIVLSRSGVTRLIDRLVADGFVARSQCSSDGRGAEAVLTDVGLDRLRQASRTHLRGIKAYFIDSVADDDLDAIRRSCESVGRRVRADERATATHDGRSA